MHLARVKDLVDPVRTLAESLRIAPCRICGQSRVAQHVVGIGCEACGVKHFRNICYILDRPVGVDADFAVTVGASFGGHHHDTVGTA